MNEILIGGLIIAVIALWIQLQSTKQRLEAMIDQSRDKFKAIEAQLLQDAEPAETLPDAPEPVAKPDEMPTKPSVETANETAIEPTPISEPELEAEQKSEPQSLQSLAFEQEDQPQITADINGAEQDPIATQASVSRFDFEDIFGRRLPIWAGGIALAIAGIFLVRYAIEAGLFTPVFRVAASFLFGFGLIGAAEFAHRNADKISDPRVCQALAGAGIATLFGAFYLAGTGYGLIGPSFAFVGLAGVTAGAIALSFRFGLPCAVLGLIGGFAAPVMVQSDSANVPLLALYLGLVTGGLAWTGVKQGQRWLSYTALAIGLGWGLLMQITGLSSSGDILALGGYLIVLGSVLPAFMYDRKGPGLLQIIAGSAATLQMAMIVAQGGFEPLTWALYLLIAAAMAVLGWRFANLRAGSAIAAFIGFWLLSLWPDATTNSVLIITTAMVAIFIALPLIHVWQERASLVDWGQIAFGSVGMGAALAYQLAIAVEPRSVGDAGLAACLLTLSLFPIAAFALHWRREAELALNLALMLLAATYLLLLPTLLLLSPTWFAPVMAAGLAIIAILLFWRREETALLIAAWASLGVTTLTLAVTPHFEPELLSLFALDQNITPIRALIRWAALLTGLSAMALIRAKTQPNHIADALAAITAYGTVAQILPGDALPAIAALGGAAMFLWKQDRFMTWGVAWAIALAWAWIPVSEWLTASVIALVGFVFMADKAIAPIDLLLRLAPAVSLSIVIAFRGGQLPREIRLAVACVSAILALVALHSLYKQAFAISSLFQFEQHGMAERSIWQLLLLLTGIAMAQFEQMRLSPRLRHIASNAFITASFVHFTWFTLIVHNPLYSPQHVGPIPIANWLMLGYGTAIISIITLRKSAFANSRMMHLASDAVMMGLIALLTISLLRQIFAGSVLIEVSIGSTESLLLSLLGIALAFGFLWWGSFTNQRSWRIGSLVLILLAVLKVFLIDAAGLEGLLRIASFMALGFSLIGIGWVYSRQLKSHPAEMKD